MSVATKPQPHSISLETFQPRGEQGRALIAYWSSLPRGNGRIPSFESCDILEISQSLPRCMILHFEKDDVWRVRMFGTMLAKRFGLDITGGNILDLFDAAGRTLAMERMYECRHRPAILQTLNTILDATGTRITSEWIFAPLVGNGTGDFSIASIEPVETIGDEARFELDGTLASRELVEINYVDF